MINSPIPCQRASFGLPKDVHYLNCAYISPLLREAHQAACGGLQKESHPWTITAPDFFEPLDQIRRRFARLINADANDIAIVPSASYGIATAAKNVRLEPEQKIVTLEDQYPSNVYVWRELARQTGGRLHVVRRPEDGDWTRAVLADIDVNTAVVAVPNNHWMDGGWLDLIRIGQAARHVDAVLVLDTSQSLGAMPLDIAQVKPDFLACAGYKWMLGPYGFSYLYVSPKWHGAEPLEYNGHNMEDGDDFPKLAQLKQHYAQGARRFDAGERAHFILAPAAAATLKQLLSWGVGNIYSTLSNLTALVEKLAEEFELSTMPTDFRAGHFIGLRFPQSRYPDGPPASLQQALIDRQVMISLRGDSLRVTPHLYNDEADISALRDCLVRALT